MTDSNNRGSILVVDDMAANLKLLSDLLKRQNYTVRAARNGPVALMSARSNPPELILLDVNMPDMDGYEVARRLKNDPETEHIPIVFISALNETEDIVKGFEVGGADYITKPFKFKEVLARVENHLTLSRQRRELEWVRERERQRFETLNRLRDQFVGGAAHDLKNPLSTVTGYVYMLEAYDTIKDDPTAQRYMGFIRRSIEKISGLVADMLEYLHIESQQILHVKPMDVSVLLRDVLADFELMAQERQIALTLVGPANLLLVPMDEKQMQRVLSNLVSNALKYTPEGGEVIVSAEADADFVYLAVRDNGLGIPPDALENLFTPFYRVKTKAHQKVAGTGLGLTVVKSIVELHGGDIAVESAEHVGTTFTVRLPLQAVAATAPAEVSEASV